MAAAQRHEARRARLLATASALALSLACLRPVGAQVVTDGTMGPAVVLGGPDVTIGADLGQTRGGNLFHSFQRFNVATGGRVAFTGPGGIRNVIGRVTGGERSAIDGILASEIEGADLYLINPAGILFGPNAQIDVKGSFHASTADQLNFADGAVFSALDTAGSTLTVAEPQSFGFLGANVGQIELQGSNLLVRSGDVLSLTAGDIALTGARIANAAVPPLPPGTTIALAAQRSAGTVPVDPSAPAVARDGDIVIASSGYGTPTFLGVIGPDGGRIKIEAGNLLVDGSSLFSGNQSADDATGGIDIGARAFRLQLRPTIAGQSGAMVTSTTGDGDAAPLRLAVADTVDIRGGVVISAAYFAAGGSGPVTVETGRFTMTGGQVGTPRVATGRGASDRTEISASDAVVLTAGASIFSGSLGDDPAGTVSVRSDGPITLEGGSRITASTLGAGQGGSVSVAGSSLSLSNSSISSSTYTGGGAAGSVAVAVAGLVELTDGGQIVSSTLGGGAGGTVTIDAAALDASGGILAGGVLSQSGVRTTAEQGSTGNAGSIAINLADSLTLTDGGQLISSTFGPGRGGDIAITAPAVALSGAFTFDGGLRLSTIQASAAVGSQGQAGAIRISAADTLSVTGGGLIVSGTYGQGAGGAVQIDAGAMTVSDAFRFGGGAYISAVRASSAVTGTGSAGSIGITADSLTIQDGGQIVSSTYGAGNGGIVALDVGTLDARGSLAAGGGIVLSGLRTTAEQGSTGNAGSIQVTAERVDLQAGAQIVSGTLGSGDGGQIAIDAGAFSATGGVNSGFGSFTSAVQASTTGTGTAGAIRITADSLDLRQGGQIVSGTFGAGDGGRVAIDVGTLTADGFFTVPGGAFVSGVLGSAAPGSTGQAGSIRIAADSLDLSAGAQIASSTFGAGDAGEIRVNASQALTVDGASINTTSATDGRGGDVTVSAPRVLVKGQGEIAASGFGSGPAGSVTVRADRLEVRDAGIRTAGTGAEGGRIAVAANERIYLRRAEVTSSGIVPAEGASVISLAAPQIVLNASTVTSLTGDGQPLAGSGEASLLGDITVISADSLVAGSSSVVISGLQTNLGSDLQLAPAGFLDVGSLLRESCAVTGTAPRSTFTRGGRGGLPPSPDRPLPSAGAAAPPAAASAGGLFLDLCALDPATSG